MKYTIKELVEGAIKDLTGDAKYYGYPTPDFSKEPHKTRLYSYVKHRCESDIKDILKDL
tara:strand:+ start:463 stop:639 length:177 start_codon:yes stop_codon:yes gene_type:complete